MGRCVRSKSTKSTMNRTPTSPDSVVTPPLQRAKFSIPYISHLEAPTPLYRGGISDHLDRLFLHISYMGRCVRSKSTKSAMNRTSTSPGSVISPLLQRALILVLHPVYLTWKHPRRLIEVEFQITLTGFSFPNGALRAVIEYEECNEPHVNLTHQCGKSTVATSAVLHPIYIPPGSTHAA